MFFGLDKGVHLSSIGDDALDLQSGVGKFHDQPVALPVGFEILRELLKFPWVSGSHSSFSGARSLPGFLNSYFPNLPWTAAAAWAARGRPRSSVVVRCSAHLHNHRPPFGLRTPPRRIQEDRNSGRQELPADVPLA